MVARVFYRQRGRAGANLRDVELDVRVGEEMLLNNNRKVDVNGKAENSTECSVLRSGRDTFQQEIPTDDLDWVFVGVHCAG